MHSCRFIAQQVPFSALTFPEIGSLDVVAGLIVPAILPFNIIKGVVISVLTAIVYKSISNLITPTKDQVKGR